ncbi:MULTISPECIES: spermidine/putrescine ABC transporter ATP-binding protein PotA [Legionella]|uniref:Spermidine/putrescine import ATP-binding protein PotA n=1 Tax=Legionella septentrionalis TaxID=2498109 RepID=A0A433JHS2_9GAMM|nr:MULTISPECIES: spermidine/putrescine ABC transporter ATP-binding protein PotA [Legionella]MCP0912917.1 spermidine/putrescine ABC transporter ATP-binding protein PotA [Legionella sp. 27cVA30]RUQ84129.1 spermidine/putrescine ABC transporter ATP-binding protein PotA [Legionella septentrionalis]RUQ95696.1 spermidine/putrescine ABC transporter ATP-binding protein PotA [Legionella septentrionalis]RUR10109.1 spermidine/putrescine ABC transporter ATP-binding protein PotA [Legionella septentrionalis]
MPIPLIEIKEVYKSYGAAVILSDVSLSVHPGEFLTLLGPSGCGKTTLLRMISGFEQPSSGNIYINGECVNHLPPQKRDVHTVFQSYALFPHLNVFENVAFALRCKGMGETEIKHRVADALKLVRLESFAQRWIRQLSGGQQQRVAIARAIISRPQVLLLDEPLSSLDYRLRKSMQYELKQLQKTLNMTFIFVTHDQEEALSMSDRIVIFNHGHIEQIGTPRQVYETPINLHVAKFIGETNIFDIKVQSVHNDSLYTEIESIRLECKNTGRFKIGEKIHLIIRPEDIRVWGENEITHTEGMLPGKIVDIVYKGSTVDLTVKLPSGKLVNASEFFDEDDDKLEYAINEAVWIQWYPGWEVLLPYES